MPRVSDARQRLMEAAQNLIWESSYGGTSVDDICARADVRKGSFYHFFKSKADLEIAALEADWQFKRKCYNEIFSPTVPPLQRLEGFFDFAYERQADFQRKSGSVLGCPYCAVGSEVGIQEDGIRQKVREIFSGVVKYLESAIRDAHAQGLIHAPDAKAKAQLLHTYFTGTMSQARIANDLGLVRAMKAGALDLLGARQSAPASA